MLHLGWLVLTVDGETPIRERWSLKNRQKLD